MRLLFLIGCYVLFLPFLYCQNKEISMLAFSPSEAEVVIKIKNNTPMKKYLFLDTANLGVFYKNAKIIRNINSSKMYLYFTNLDSRLAFIGVYTYSIYAGGTKDLENFLSEIKEHTLVFMPYQEKKIVLNLYKQPESEYLKVYKVLPPKNYQVRLKICGQKIKRLIERVALQDTELRKELQKYNYDFNNYESNLFKLKIKTVKSPPPPPLPPLEEGYPKYSYEELMK